MDSYNRDRFIDQLINVIYPTIIYYIYGSVVRVLPTYFCVAIG